MKAKEIMVKDLKTISKNANVKEALDKMRNYGVSRLLVVKGEDTNIVGIITERDITERLGSRRAGSLPPTKIYVSSCMSPNLITINEEDDVKKVADLMLTKGVSSLIVKLHNEKITGILTVTDLVRVCLTIDDFKVSDIMSKNPFTVSPSSRMIDARDKIISEEVSTLPVVDGGMVIGTISEKEIALALTSIRKNTPPNLLNARIRMILVGDVMKRNPPTITENAPICKAAKLILESHEKSLPVVDEQIRLKGIISKTDFLKVITRKFA
jgi:CBS domain-containing protein